MEKANRVAVVGIGLINSQATGTEAFSQNRDCLPFFVVDDNYFPGTNSRVGFSKIGEVDTGSYLPGISLRCVDKITVYTGIAASMALGSRIADNTVDASEIGAALGTAMGSIVSISDFDLKALAEGPNAVNPMEFPNTVSNAPASRMGIWFKLKGPSVTISNGFTSSMDAIGFAFNEIACGEARYYLAGGSEDLSDHVYRGYSRVSMEKRWRPVDDDAVEIMGEGSGLLLLTGMETARAAGYETEGEIIDFFSSKMIPDASYVKNVVSILNSIIYENSMLKNKTLIYTSYMPFNELSCKVFEELERCFGKESLVITNRVENAYMNYTGTNGVFNTAYALRDMKRRGNGTKSALVLDIACDGKFSCTAVKL